MIKSDKKKLIQGLIKRHKEGLTVVEIAKHLKISRNTVAVYLAELKGEKKIWIRNVGMAKLNYWGRGK
jgi:DNA-binding transcriptional regulator LsrR (DeoR family)